MSAYPEVLMSVDIERTFGETRRWVKVIAG